MKPTAAAPHSSWICGRECSIHQLSCRLLQTDLTACQISFGTRDNLVWHSGLRGLLCSLLHSVLGILAVIPLDDVM